jgi:hypothetical protein
MNTAAPHARSKWHDAYDNQMALWRWYRRDEGRRWLSLSWQINSDGLSVNTRAMLGDLYSAESERLLDCDPIYVSRGMCELVEAAASSFAPEPLLETDVITPRGFMLYERPFVIPDRFEDPTSIAAVSWGNIYAIDEKEREATNEEIGNVTYEPGVHALEAEKIMLAHGAQKMGIAITLYATRKGETLKSAPGAPEIVPYHLTPWYYGMTFDGNEVDENEAPTGAEWWWKLVQTTFRLMQQPIAVKHQQRPDRTTRREAKKLSFPDEQTVVVVRLRREDSERHDPSGEDANYSHRFIVNGHWRNQWYPSIDGHRQIWISPYVKGDPGLPLIVKPRRVFQWER